jgi:hypothetical protein
MNITRKEFLKLAGGAAIALPLGSLAIASCNHRSSSSGKRASHIAVTPFQVPLPIPPMLQPTRSDCTTDYYEITQKEGQVEILPGFRTTIWGYNGIFPVPTIAVRSGRQVVVRHRTKLDPVIATYSQKLKDEQSRQFQVQTEMFKNLGVENPRQRSLYFSSTLQGIMLMYSTYPKTIPLDTLKAQVIAEFCNDS